MKKKTKKIIGIVCAILLIVLLQAIGITYAKYIASESGSGHAKVAKWAFQIVKDGEETKTINLASTVDKETLIDGKIAPGTSGTFEISVDASGSEVDLDYTIEFANEKNKPNNLVFVYKGLNYKSLSDIKISGKIENYKENKVKNESITWKWNYETGKTEDEITTNDKLDTQDAEKIAQYTFDIITTATQSN
mgnify:CR=1 FL=1